MSISVPELASITSLKWYQADETATDITKTVILRGKADHGELFNNDILTSLNGGRIGEYGYYVGHAVRYGGGGRIYDEIEITCMDLNVNLKDPDGSGAYYSRFEAIGRTESRPLEEKRVKSGTNDETYVTWWNHMVVCQNENETIVTTGGGSDDWKIITDKTIPSGYTPTDATKPARWVKSNQALNKGEYVLLDARYPGVQSYGVPMEQVKELMYTRSLGRVKAAIAAVGKLYAPVDHTGTYYGNSENAKWLITNATYVKKAGWYESTITYAFAKGGWLPANPASPGEAVYAIAGT